jgi:hypothetical protein
VATITDVMHLVNTVVKGVILICPRGRCRLADTLRRAFVIHGKEYPKGTLRFARGAAVIKGCSGSIKSGQTLSGIAQVTDVIARWLSHKVAGISFGFAKSVSKLRYEFIKSLI